jgi:hypothetical protein
MVISYFEKKKTNGHNKKGVSDAGELTMALFATFVASIIAPAYKFLMLLKDSLFT